MRSTSARMSPTPRPPSDAKSSPMSARVPESKPCPVSTTRITHTCPFTVTSTRYSSPGPECSSTLVQASVSAISMSLVQSGATPTSLRASRQM